MGEIKTARDYVRIDGQDDLKIWQDCGGFYECPKDGNGNRLGLLVGYAGRYDAEDGTKKQWVGDIYANFAKVEEYPHVLHYFANKLYRERVYLADHPIKLPGVLVGAPLGGYDFCKMIGLVFDRRTIKAEKKIIALATAESREKSVPVFGRHELKAGEEVAIVEDVCNNFSTTDQLIELVHAANSKVTMIICALNRSLTVEGKYLTKFGEEIPVISLIRLPISEYKQDDPQVAEDITKGNVVWKPKDDWGKLMEAMKSVKK